MRTSRAAYEQLLVEWRNAETRVECMRAFDNNGGTFRLRIETDGNHPVEASVLHDLMSGNGYRFVMTNAIKEAERRADAAKRRFLEAAAGEVVGLDLASGKAV